MYYIQGNIIFYSTHPIFDKKIFPKCTDSYTKECKLYDNLLNKISLEIKLLAPSLSSKDIPTPVPILYIYIPPIQNNSPTCSPSSSFFYKSLSPSSTLESKKPTVKVKEVNNVDSDVEMSKTLKTYSSDTTRRS